MLMCFYYCACAIVSLNPLFVGSLISVPVHSFVHLSVHLSSNPHTCSFICYFDIPPFSHSYSFVHLSGYLFIYSFVSFVPLFVHSSFIRLSFCSLIHLLARSLFCSFIYSFSRSFVCLDKVDKRVLQLQIVISK